ncbi:MAG: bifunctional oligoribonuclease/PAP phosphatase NrnA [Opitutales bacterium]
MFFPEASPRFGQLLESIRGQKFAVIGHMRPDGDCVGSQVGLCRVLQALGSEAVCVNHHTVPRVLKAFVGDTPFLLASDFTPDGHLAATVDCADPKRIGEHLRACFPQVRLNIDHHLSNPAYAEDNFIEDGTAATAEILAGFFFDLNLPIDPITAQALYIGISTDTGQFRFGSTTARVFEITARLVEKGANAGDAAFELFENERFAKLKLLEAYLQTLRLECEGRFCIGLLPEGIYESTSSDREDAEGLVDYARAIEGVEIGVLIEESGGSLKGSLRAKDPKYRVDQIAKEFGGGGHAAAAGFNLEGTIQDFLPRLRAAVEARLAAASVA